VDKLLPCPFCGECASLKMVVVNGSRRYGVVCEGGGCPLNNPLTYISTAKWNRRAPQAQEETRGAPGPAFADRLMAVGYAPGGYSIWCQRCRKMANGCDKRAITCHPCAVAMVNAPAPASPAALVWTKEKPKADGFYWYRVPGQSKQSIDLVQLFTGSPCWHSAERHAWVPITWDLEWAGPIPEPAAPEAGAPGTQEGGSQP
jgi:hypothetical protein